MSIWKTPMSMDLVKERSDGTMISHLDIEFTDVGEDYLVARMPVDHRTLQPIGIMHGGASCVLAETVGSTAANFCVNISTHYCVGLDINTNHIRAIREGFVTGTARPYHLGGSTQVWGIEIVDESKRLISMTRLTMMILSRKGALSDEPKNLS